MNEKTLFIEYYLCDFAYNDNIQEIIDNEKVDVTLKLKNKNTCLSNNDYYTIFNDNNQKFTENKRANIKVKLCT